MSEWTDENQATYESILRAFETASPGSRILEIYAERHPREMERALETLFAEQYDA